MTKECLLSTDFILASPRRAVPRGEETINEFLHDSGGADGGHYSLLLLLLIYFFRDGEGGDIEAKGAS